MDLPGIGTPTYPDLDIYCEKVDLESYDTFLILTASRFTQHEFKLAEKIKSMEKSYFLVRTKIDIDDMNEKSRKKKHNTEEMLKKIRKYCQKGVEGLGILENDIFLISNFHPSTWDFPRMVDAILSKLSVHQKEALTLSLRIKYKKSVERKVEILKGKTWLVTLLFIPALPLDLVSANFFSHLINCAEIKRRMKEYRYQLRLPEEDSDAFERMNERLQDEMKEFYTKEDGNFWNKYFGCITSMPILSTVQKARQTNLCLHRILDDMQEMAFKILDDAAATDTDEPMEQ
ncbi:interferon-inducible GTPase 1-like [Dendronephthya gigantea]|uniref:interferon-inducible GTPase 1-like n=1 Tax=Dendronephthya gigantea TaxID=151771 RepID=UPI00106921A3|nr:interferon-inducible GTPase 1-like [Dendronephthya gigantea]